MLLDLDFKFTQLNGDFFDSETAANHVAIRLTMIKSDFDPIDAWDFAKSLKSNGNVDMKSTDLDILEKFIRNSDLAPIAQAQIIRKIKNAKELVE